MLLAGNVCSVLNDMFVSRPAEIADRVDHRSLLEKKTKHRDKCVAVGASPFGIRAKLGIVQVSVRSLCSLHSDTVQAVWFTSREIFSDTWSYFRFVC